MVMARAISILAAGAVASIDLRQVVLSSHISKPYLLKKIANANSKSEILLGELKNYQTSSKTNLFTKEFTDRLYWDSQGKEFHGYMVKSGIEQNTFYQTKLIFMYANCENLEDARQVFDELHVRNMFSWTAMITGYVKQKYFEEALRLLNQMHSAGFQPDPFVLPSILKACAGIEALQLAKSVHALIITSGFESNLFVAGALVDMYAKCRRIEFARQVFDEIPQRSVVAWNAMIAGYAQNGQTEDALKHFCQMQREGMKPSSVTVIVLLPACASFGVLRQIREIHCYIIKFGYDSDVIVGTTIVDMYIKCRSMEDADQVFEQMPKRNVVSWNAMIAGYGQNGQPEEAWELFLQMQLEGLEPDVITWNVVITGYAQNGYGDEALKVFHQMQLVGIEPDVVSWNSMIAGYAQNEHSDEALKSFRQMLISGTKPNSVTMSSLLPVCSNLATLQQGKEIHGFMIRSGFESDVFAGSALLDMYAKCGSIENACHVFGKMSPPSLVAWNAMIAGYAMHGQSEHALRLFSRMQRECIKPDHITFIGVLFACSHAGQMNDGWQYFHCMSQNYHIEPKVEHYACMVDLLGRAGCLAEAYEIVTKMPLRPDARVWGALLGACRIHHNTQLANLAAEHLFELEPENIGSYILLSNIHAAAGRWDGVAKVRKMMKDRGLRKSPGCSWIGIKNRVHVFLAGDTLHPQIEEIREMLGQLTRQMKVAGYVPDTKFVLHDLD